MAMRLRRRGLWALAGAALLPACGFELRRAPAMPFSRIALGGFAPRSPLAEEFKRSFAPGVQVLDAPAQAEVVLHALLDTREKSVVASTSAGQVREVQLRVKFNFRVQSPGGRVLLPEAELLLTRDMSYSETTALAKQYEEAQLYREMQSDVVAQVVQRLSTLRMVPG
jgi:LPS-assembly lipoprotein